MKRKLTAQEMYTKRQAAIRRRTLMGALRIAQSSRAPPPQVLYPKRIQTLPASFQPTGSEIKAIDVDSVTYLLRHPATATDLVLINGVQTGTGFFNRVGSRIEMKSVHLRGNLYNVATSTSTIGRVLVMYDRQPTGALPVISDILQSRTQVGTASTDYTSEINLDNRDRFIILRDYQVFLPPCTNTAGVLTNGPSYPGMDNSMDINLFIKLKGLGTHFKSSSNPTTIADISTGALYMAFVAGADSKWAADIGVRLRFDDK